MMDWLAWSEASDASDTAENIEEKVEQLIQSQKAEMKMLIKICQKLGIDYEK